MSKFIKLTKTDEIPMYVNVDHIVEFRESQRTPQSTFIVLTGDEYCVLETTEEIIHLINEKQN